MINPDLPPFSNVAHKETPSQKRAASRASQRIALLALFIPLAFGLGLGSGYWLWGRDKSPAAAGSAQAQDGAGSEQTVKRYPVPTDDDPAIGPENAPITLIEFSDYQCPYCSKWYHETFAQIRRDYPDQVRIVYRDFPLPSHPDATPAAEAANCANEQGAYWEFADKLWKAEQGLSVQAYSQYARQLGLDVEKFNACVQERRYKDEVAADLQYASNLGVNSTPTFFLNGLPLVGAQPYETFKQVIDKELAGEIP